MQRISLIRRRLSPAAVAVFAAVICGGGCASDSGSVELTTAMHPKLADRFGKLVTDYNRSHSATPITWRNVTSEEALASDGSAHQWVIASSATARGWRDRQSFTSSLSQRTVTGLIKGFGDLRRTAPDESMLPLLGMQPVVIADYVAITAAKGRIPATIGELLSLAHSHRATSRRYFFAPPFGDAETILRFVASQGGGFTDPAGNVRFPAGELAPLLQPWVDAFRRGDLPKECLGWHEAEAARFMVSGKADMTLGGATAVDVVAARPDKKSRRFHFYRPATGVVDDQWVEPIGLVKVSKGGVSLAAQNMAAFLTSVPAQQALADGYQAVPLVAEAMKTFGDQVTGLTEARTTFLNAVAMHAVNGLPFVPLQPQRQLVAQAIQQALKEAVGGVPLREAIERADAAYHEQVDKGGQ